MPFNILVGFVRTVEYQGFGLRKSGVEISKLNIKGLLGGDENQIYDVKNRN